MKLFLIRLLLVLVFFLLFSFVITSTLEPLLLAFVLTYIFEPLISQYV